MKPHREHFRQKKTLVKMIQLVNSLILLENRKPVSGRLNHSEWGVECKDMRMQRQGPNHLEPSD